MKTVYVVYHPFLPGQRDIFHPESNGVTRTYPSKAEADRAVRYLITLGYSPVFWQQTFSESAAAPITN